MGEKTEFGCAWRGPSFALVRALVCAVWALLWWGAGGLFPLATQDAMADSNQESAAPLSRIFQLRVNASDSETESDTAGDGAGGSASTVCATGFALNAHTLLTNMHVARSLCPYGRCERAQLLRASGVGEIPQPAPYRIALRAQVGAFDIAALEITPALPWDLPEEHLIAPPQSGQTVRVFGYPGCSTLQVGMGRVTEVTPLGFALDAPTNFGGSGSIVVAPSGALLGLISQADVSLTFLVQRLLGQEFRGRAARLDSAVPLLAVSFDEKVGRESQAILEWYDTHFSLGSLDLFESLEFFSRVERLKTGALQGQQGLEAAQDAIGCGLAVLGEKQLDETPCLRSLSQSVPNLAELIFLYNLESHGMRSLPGAASSGDSALLRAAQRFVRVHQRGGLAPLRHSFLMRQFSQNISFVLVLGVIICLWLVSSGIVLGATSGGVVRRIAITALVALSVWPISFLVWMMIVMRSRQVRAAGR